MAKLLAAVYIDAETAEMSLRHPDSIPDNSKLHRLAVVALPIADEADQLAARLNIITPPPTAPAAG